MNKNLFIICLFYSIAVLGHENKENFIHLNTRNGKLMHNTVEAIARDQFGYIWAGTNFGLARLDGYQSLNFNKAQTQPNSLSNNSIKALLVDSSNEIWIGTIGGGMDHYNRKTNEFSHYIPSDTINSIDGINISALCEDHEGNIWIGTAGKGLTKLNKEDETFTHIELEKHDPFKRTNSNVDILFCDKQGFIWIGLNQGEIYKIDTQNNKITFYGLQMPPDVLNIGAIMGIDQQKNGDLLFASWNGSLFKLSPEKSQYIQLMKSPKYFNYSILSDLKIDSQNNIWISTWNNGLYKIQDRNNKKIHYRHRPNQPNGLGSNAINRLYIDKQNNLWICYLDNGIGMLPLKKESFKTLDLQSDKYDYINVFAITKDNKNNIWIGTRGKGLWKYNSQKKSISNIYSQNNKNINSVLALKWSIDNNLIIGSDGGFVSIYHPKTNNYVPIKHKDDDWSNAVFCIAENKNFIWAGTWGGGIKKIDKKDYSYTSINFNSKDQFKNSIFDIEIVDSILWIANIELGLIKYNINNNTYKCYCNSEKNPDFPLAKINDIYVENSNSLWISTDGSGFFNFIPSKEKVLSYDKQTNSQYSITQSILSDKHNNLWINSISGLSHINTINKKWNNINLQNQGDNNQFNKSASFFDSENNMIYLGGVEGVIYFCPDTIAIDTLINPVVITQLSISSKNPQSTFGQNTTKIFTVPDTICLNHDDNTITIYFSSMQFISTPQYHYKYRLEGFDKHWAEMNYPNNFIQYTNLNPGKYTLHLKSCNNGIHNTQETTLKILVKPAFWQTLLFKSFILLVILILIVFIFNKKHNNLLDAKKVLEQKVLERTHKIGMQKQKIENQNKDLEHANKTKDKFLSIISHDLRNPMASIKQLIEVIDFQYNNVDGKKMRSYFELLKKSSDKTLSLLDNLLLWAQSQTNRINVNKEDVLIDEIFNEAKSQCFPQAKKKNIKLKIPSESESYAYIDKNTMLTVLRNLISNSIKYSPSDSTVTIKLNERPNHWIIKIQDQGIGMTQTQIQNLFKIGNIHSSKGTAGETGSGLGLLLCLEFTTLNNGSIWVESEKNIGTTFYISVEKIKTS